MMASQETLPCLKHTHTHIAHYDPELVKHIEFTWNTPACLHSVWCDDFYIPAQTMRGSQVKTPFEQQKLHKMTQSLSTLLSLPETPPFCWRNIWYVPCTHKFITFGCLGWQQHHWTPNHNMTEFVKYIGLTWGIPVLGITQMSRWMNGSSSERLRQLWIVACLHVQHDDSPW